jgi:hypothetical protein
MKLSQALVTVTFALACSPCFAGTPSSSSEAARALESQAKKTLGVSVRALAFLFDSEPGTVISMHSVSLQSAWSQLESLEKAGLVRLHKFGGTSGADYLSIELTAKGQAVAAQLSGP